MGGNVICILGLDIDRWMNGIVVEFGDGSLMELGGDFEKCTFMCFLCCSF